MSRPAKTKAKTTTIKAFADWAKDTYGEMFEDCWSKEDAELILSYMRDAWSEAVKRELKRKRF